MSGKCNMSVICTCNAYKRGTKEVKVKRNKFGKVYLYKTQMCDAKRRWDISTRQINRRAKRDTKQEYQDILREVNSPNLIHATSWKSDQKSCHQKRRTNLRDNVTDSSSKDNSYFYQFSDNETDNQSNDFSDSVEEISSERDIDLEKDTVEVCRNERFQNELVQWAIHFNIRHNALKHLLSILNRNSFTLPTDPRTLLNTPSNTNIIDMGTGQYIHIGMQSAINNIIKDRLSQNHKFNCINLLINIDGAPITGNSSEKGLWIILGKDTELVTVQVIGIYHGPAKPEDANQFLKYFVDECTELIKNGYNYDEKAYTVKIRGFICDSPAKSFILCTKYHSGYHNCSKCTIQGEYYNNVSFPVQDINSLKDYCNKHLRTDDKFNKLEYLEDYQRGTTTLSNLFPDVGLVSNVPIDPMHTIYLGVMRQLIRHWIGDKGRKNKKYKLSEAQIEIISSRLESFRNILPADFNRRTRSLKCWRHWKATEYRHLLLYFGPIILKNTLNPLVYNNFLKLHISILILSNKTLVKENANLEYAECLLIEFIYDFQEIYGKENVTFNIHSLLHLVKDVKSFGSLEEFSAFCFENYIYRLKKLVRKGAFPLQQIARRLHEITVMKTVKNNSEENNEIVAEKIHFNGILPDIDHVDMQYKSVRTRSFCLNITDDRNNCAMLSDGTIINVLNIIKIRKKLYIVGKRCNPQKDLFKISNFCSGLLGIYIVVQSDVIQYWPCDKLHCKIFKIPYNNGYITYPIIHTY